MMIFLLSSQSRDTQQKLLLLLVVSAHLPDPNPTSSAKCSVYSHCYVQTNTTGLRKGRTTLNLILNAVHQMITHTEQSYRASEVVFKEVQGSGATGGQDDVKRSIVDP